MKTLDTGLRFDPELPRDVLCLAEADAIIDHGRGCFQEIRIETDYGLDAYLAILQRDRREIALAVAKLALPRLAFERAAGSRSPRQIRVRRPVPVGRSGVAWEARYTTEEATGPCCRRLRPSWWKRLLNAAVRLMPWRLQEDHRPSEVLVSYDVIGIWGPPSARLSRALGRLSRACVFQISRAAWPPGLRVAMRSLDLPGPTGKKTVFVVDERSVLDGNTPASDVARKFGATEIVVVTEGTECRTSEPLRIPLPSPPRWPRISVVTVSYQQARFLETCLRSVLDQGYPNLEYIVIDGGSDDGSREILERYRPRLSTLVIEPDRGQSDALNKGFSRATGDMLTWICSDDCLEPGSLFTARVHTGADVIAGGCRLIDGDGRTTGIHHSGFQTGLTQPLSFGDMASFMGSWQRGVYFFQPELFFSRDLWQRSGGHLREDLFYAMDYDLFLRFGLAGGRVHAVPEVLGCSRRHLDQKTRHELPLYLPTIDRVLADFAADLAALAESAGRPPVEPSASPPQP